MALKFNPFTGNFDIVGATSGQLGNYVLKAGDAMTGPLTIDGSTDVKQLVVQAVAGQTAAIAEWQDSTGASLARITSAGLLVAASGATVSDLLTLNGGSTGSTILLSSSNRKIAFGGSASSIASILTVNASGATNVAIVAKGAASQSANIQQWQDSTGSVLAYVRNDGLAFFNGVLISSNSQIRAGNGAGGRMKFTDSQSITIDTSSASVVPIVVKGAAAQTADLQEWHDSSGVILTAVAPDGKLLFGPSGAQDTNLYRSAADTLQTDDTLIVGGASIAVGTNPAQSGSIRVPNNAYITARNSGNSADLDMIRVTTAGVIQFGQSISGMSMTNGTNITVGTSTGTKLGTAAAQKLGFWNATPIVQPTTADAAATFVTNTSLIANDTATFDGYTIGQVVKALRNIGVLA